MTRSSEAAEKLTWFVPWHPGKGYQHEMVCLTPEEALNRLCLWNGYYEDADLCAGPICPDEAQEDGWQIREVELVFKDGKYDYAKK